MTEFYKQCELRFENTTTVAWIAERGAKVGCSVTLKDSDDPTKWWEVVSAGTTRMSKEEALERERDYLKQRDASDIYRGSRVQND